MRDLAPSFAAIYLAIRQAGFLTLGRELFSTYVRPLRSFAPALIGLFFTVALVVHPGTVFAFTQDDGMMTWGAYSGTDLDYSVYTNSAADDSKFFYPGSVETSSSQAEWSRMIFSPKGTRVGFAVYNDSTTLHANKFDGSSWATSTTAAILNTTGNNRNFDAAFEQTSGDAVVVYEGSTGRIYWTRWTGSSWSTPAYVYSSEPGTIVSWMTLSPSPTSDNMILLWSDTSGGLYSISYNGSTWETGSAELIDSNIGTSSRAFDIAWEHSSGQALMTYAHNGAATSKYRTRGTTISAAWGSETNLPTGFGVKAEYTDLEANPATDQIAALWWMSGSADDLAGAIWTGLAWQLQDNIDTDVYNYGSSYIGDEQPASAGWVNNGSTWNAVIVYSGTTASGTTINTCIATTGTLWSCSIPTPSGNTSALFPNPIYWVTQTTSTGRLVAVQEGSSAYGDVKAMYSDNGTSWACINGCNLGSLFNIGSTAKHFDFVIDTSATTGTLGTWDGGGADANFSTAANWEQDTVPGASDPLVFPAGTKAATWDASGPATVASLTVDTGYNNTITVSRNVTVTGAVSVESGSTLSLGTTSPTFGAAGVAHATTINGSLTQSSGTLTFAGIETLSGSGTSSPYSVSAVSLNLSYTGTLTVNGNLTHTSKLALNNKSFTIKGNLTSSGTSALIWGSSGAAIVTAGTVIIDGNFTSTVSSGGGVAFFYDLQFGDAVGTRTSTVSVTASQTITVYHNLIVSTGQTLALGSTDIYVAASSGFITGAGSITQTGGTVSLGSGSNNVGGTGTSVGTCSGSSGSFQFYNLTFSGEGYATTSTLCTDITVSGVLTLGDSYRTLVAGSRTITLSGSGTPFVLNGGTFTYGTSTVQYTNGTSANVTATTYYNLTTSGAGNYMLAGATTVNNDVTVNTGSLSLNGQTLTVSGGDLTGTGTVYCANGNNTSCASATTTVSGTGNIGSASHTFTFSTLVLSGNSQTSTFIGDIETKGTNGLWCGYGTSHTCATGGHNVTVGGQLSVYGVSSGTTATFSVGNGSAVSTTTLILYDIGDSTRLGTYTGNTSTLTLTTAGISQGSGTIDVSSATVNYQADAVIAVLSTTYGALTLNPTITVARAYTLPAVTTGSLTINPSAGSALALTVTLSGALSVSGATTIQGTSFGTGTLDTSASNYALSSASLAISSGGTLIANGSTVTLSGSGTAFSNGGTFIPGTSTVVYTGATPTVLATTYNNLNLSPASLATVGAGTLTANDVSVTSGTVSGATNNPALAISGNLALSTGSALTRGSGTMTLSGTSKTITDSTATLQNLGVVSVSGSYSLSTNSTMQSLAGAGSLTTNAYTLTLTGSGSALSITTFTASAGSTVAYTSSTGATVSSTPSYYNLTINGSGTFSAGGNLVATNDLAVSGGTLALGTNNLTVGSSASGVGSISGAGTITSFASSTSTLYGTGTLGGGTYSFYNLTLGDGITPNFTTTLSGSITVSNVFTVAAAHTFDPASGTLILSGTSGTPLVNNGLFSGPSSSTVIYSGANAGGDTTVADVTYNNLQLTGADTYTIGTDLYVTNILIIDTNATFVPSSYTIHLTGTDVTPLSIAGTFTPGTSTVIYAGVAPTVLATTYNNLTLSTSGTATIGVGTLQAADLTITSGTVTGAVNNPTVTLSGNLSLASGVTFTKSANTLSLAGTGKTVTDSTAGTQDLGAIAVSGSYSFMSDLTMRSLSGSGSVTSNAHTLTLTSSGSPLSVTTFTASPDSTVVYTSGSGAVIRSISALQNLTINGGGTFTTPGTVIVNGTLLVSGGTFALGSYDLVVGSTSVASSGSIEVASGQGLTQTATNTTTIYSSSSGANCIGSSGVNCSGTAGTITLGNLVLGNGTTAATTTIGGTTSVTVAGVLTIATNHTLDGSAATITLSGTSGTPLAISGTFTPSTSTVAYSGNNTAGNTTVTSATYYSLETSGAETYDLGGGTTVNGVLTIGGSATLDAQSYTLTLTGTTGTPFVKTGTFTPSTSTVVYSGNNTGGNTTVIGIPYYNLQTSGAETYDLGGGTTVNGVLTIGGSATLDAQSYTLTLAGTTGTPFVKTGTFTPSTSTVVYSGDNGSGTTAVVAATYYNLTINNAAETYEGQTGTVTVGNNFEISAGTLNLATNAAALSVSGSVTNGGTLIGSGSVAITVYGDWTNNGTFTHSNGTVVIASPDAAGSTSNVGGSSNTDFYNLTVTSPGKTVRFAAQKTFGIAGTFTVTGSAALVNLFSSAVGVGTSSTDRWLLSLTGSTNFDHVGVRNAGCALGSNEVPAQSTVYDLQNNDTTCWKFTSLGNGGGGGGGGGGIVVSGANDLGGAAAPSGGGGGGGTPTAGGTTQGSGSSSSRSD